MTTLTLYKGVDFDGVNSFPYIPSNGAGAFDGYLSGKQQYTQDIHFNRIGEPILINESYDTAIGYSYGCIDTGDKKYYIIPDSISVNENNRVYLTYTVDWFTTLEYDDAISFGRAHLIKSTDVSPLSYPQGIQPIDVRISSISPLQDSGAGEIHVAYTTDDDKSNVKWILNRVDNGFSKTEVADAYGPDNTKEVRTGPSIGAPEIMDGVLSRACGVRPAEILGIYYVPFELSYTILSDVYYARYKEVDGKTYIWYVLRDDRFDYPLTRPGYKDFNLTSNAMKSVHMVDRYGSIIYSVPYGRTLKRVLYQPIITPTASFVTFEFFYNDDEFPSDSTVVKGLGLNPKQADLTNGWLATTGRNPNTGDILEDLTYNRMWVYNGSTWVIQDDRYRLTATQNVENSFMLYMCEKVDYNVDAYANWAMGLKEVEIEERRIQKNKGLMSGLGNSVLTGAIGGASGNPLGAGLGVAGGVASAFLSYGLDTYYESSVNSLEDQKYQLAQDTMIPGGFLPYVHPTLSIVELSASDDDIARYNDEILNFGADCNLPVSSWSPSVGAYKFADVEVIADVPYSIKQNIKQKMQSGIKIVEV